MSRVVHFEVQAKDKDAAQKFYGDVFGWTFTAMGDQMGDYRVIKTGEDGTAPENMGINGGIAGRVGDLPKAGDAVNAFVCIIGVTNIDETLAKIMAAGGTMALDKMDVPTVGMLAYCKDLEGNLFGVLQPSAEMVNEKK